MLDSTHLKPLSNDISKIPAITLSINHNLLLSRCSSPSSPSSPVKIVSADNFNEQFKTLGDCEWISKEETIKRFSGKHYKIGFWSSIQTKTLGTFIVVTTQDSQMHFLSMRRKISSCNFQYDFSEKKIFTRECSGCELYKSSIEIETQFYDFPDQVMILTPKEPYESPIFLSKM